MHYVSRGGGGHGYVDQLKKITFKIVHYEGCFNLFPGK